MASDNAMSSTSALQLDSSIPDSDEPQVSLCITSSAISQGNASNLEQITHVAYQIAKAATVYNVSEVIVLDVPIKDTRVKINNVKSETLSSTSMGVGNTKIKFETDSDDQDEVHREDNNGINHQVKIQRSVELSFLLASLLQFFVTPKYLVKSVFHNNPCGKKFRYAEKLPKLSSLPFMKLTQAGSYKEGFTVSKRAPQVRKKSKKGSAVKKLKVTKYVNVGDSKLLELDGPEVPTNVRVTVNVNLRKVVSPQTAYENPGCKVSYGYYVRIAKSFSAVFTELIHPDGYTESIFVNADTYFSLSESSELPNKDRINNGKSLLIIGSAQDLEFTFKQETIEGVENVNEIFDFKIPVPLNLRIEDAALVSLAMMRRNGA